MKKKKQPGRRNVKPQYDSHATIPIFCARFNEETSRLSQSIFNKSEKRVEANAFTANFHDAALLFSMVIVRAAIIFFLS